MRRLLVIGGSGYLGGELLRQAQLAGFVSIGTAHRNTGGGLVPLDLTDARSVRALLDAERPDVVINAAYVQSGDQLDAITRDGAARAASETARIGARFVHLSTDALFDGDGQGHYRESDPPSPITAYGVAKAEAEGLVLDAAPDSLIVRTSLLYGAGHQGAQERLVVDALEHPDLVAFFTDEIRSPILVTELARALLELAERDDSGVLNVAGADDCDRFECARRIAVSLGRDPRRLRSAVSTDLGLRRPRNCSLDSSRARSLLATHLRGIRDVLPELEPTGCDRRFRGGVFGP